MRVSAGVHGQHCADCDAAKLRTDHFRCAHRATLPLLNRAYLTDQYVNLACLNARMSEPKLLFLCRRLCELLSSRTQSFDGR